VEFVIMQVEEITGRKVDDVVIAPSLTPDYPPIDLNHLARMMRGDDKMMREFLEVFSLQADLLLSRIMSEAPKAAAARSHILADSARSVGAWRIAETANELEQLALQPGPVTLNSAMRHLLAAVSEAGAQIDGLARALGTG
jgi:HPt (histidine-containing phosphotransfer) domain-containing protein